MVKVKSIYTEICSPTKHIRTGRAQHTLTDAWIVCFTQNVEIEFSKHKYECNGILFLPSPQPNTLVMKLRLSLISWLNVIRFYQDSSSANVEIDNI